jgi:PAS domain-containing protein
MCRWHLVRGLPIGDVSPAGVSWIGIAVAIHDIMLAPIGLADKSEKLSLALEIANLGTLDDDLQGPVRVSDRARQLLGLPPEAEVTWPNLLARVHPEDRGSLEDAIKDSRRLESAGATELTYRVTGADAPLDYFALQVPIFRLRAKSEAAMPYRDADGSHGNENPGERAAGQ